MRIRGAADGLDTLIDDPHSGSLCSTPSQDLPQVGEGTCNTTVAYHNKERRPKPTRHQEPRRFLGLFSLAGTGRALCFNASRNVWGRWCLASKSTKASSASCCRLFPLSVESNSSARKVSGSKPMSFAGHGDRDIADAPKKNAPNAVRTQYGASSGSK